MRIENRKAVHFGKFTPEEIAHYLKAHGTIAQLHAVSECTARFLPMRNSPQRKVDHCPHHYSSFFGTSDGSPLANLTPKLQMVCVCPDVLMSKA